MSFDPFQFYPTPAKLAARAWAKFKCKDFRRVLEPSAGFGSLISAFPGGRSYHRDRPPIDVIEIDLAKHANLRELGVTVVGLDFLNFAGGEVYSHVLMNPPFAAGAAHVLKAWDMLWEGEIVAIINAETLRNPWSAERRRLVKLLEEHGDVEYIVDAFKGADVEREADVEIALVRLTKPEQAVADWFGPVLDAMRKDGDGQDDPSVYQLPGELALPESFVENQCRIFRSAVRATREAVKAQSIAGRMASRLGETLSTRNEVPGDKQKTGHAVAAEFSDRYDNLKDRAWASVLRSTTVLQKLSAKVQREAESQFETIKKLEFTEANVYAFLLGLVQSQGTMQIDMMCDVFDQISCYHSDNTVFYRGWKSNDKHRTCGLRIKTTRFILPGYAADNWSTSMNYRAQQMLSDFDKVFAMVDGKTRPTVGLLDIVNSHYKALCAGERVQSTYFDLRYYPGVGTLHFFARDKKLVDRLNRFVGAHRAWLPPANEPVSDAFWLQYDKAEKFDTRIRAEVKKARCNHWDDPLRTVTSSHRDADEKARAHNALGAAIDTVLREEGLLEALDHEAAASNAALMLECA